MVDFTICLKFSSAICYLQNYTPIQIYNLWGNCNGWPQSIIISILRAILFLRIPQLIIYSTLVWEVLKLLQHLYMWHTTDNNQSTFHAHKNFKLPAITFIWKNWTPHFKSILKLHCLGIWFFIYFKWYPTFDSINTKTLCHISILIL